MDLAASGRLRTRTHTCCLFVALLPAVPLAAQEKALAPAAPPAPAANLDCERRLAEDFVPMSRTERLGYALRTTFGPQPVLFSAISAAETQWKGNPKEWGQGAEGYGRRFGSSYATRIINNTIQHSAALVFHEDNRYFASGEEGVGRRLRYAVSSAFLARHDDGSRHVSISALGGAVGGAFISRAWQPPTTNTSGDAAVSFGVSMATRIGLNVFREFAPRPLARIFR